MRPFADAVADYALAGWPCILPVPVATKSPPPVGFTGEDGIDTSAGQLVVWAGTHADHSIALRMPDGVIGIDVDHYRKGNVDKRGGDSLAEYEAEWGPLPPTWRSSARDLPSGIRFFRVPPGRYATRLGESIEIIQRHHRYAVVAPSINPDAAGAVYRWYDPSGALSASVPKPDELAELPAAWVAGLREGASEAGPAAADIGRGQALLSLLLTDDRPPCGVAKDAYNEATRQLSEAASGSRHDVTTARVQHLVQLGAEGHPGIGGLLRLVQQQWAELTAGEGREAEYDRMMLTAARKAVTKHGQRPPPQDICNYLNAFPTPAVAPSVPPAVQPTGEPLPQREVFPPHTAPVAVARRFEADFRHANGTSTLRFWRDSWMAWHGSHWAEMEKITVEAAVQRRLEHAVVMAEGKPPAPWLPTPRRINEVVHSWARLDPLDGNTDPPSWIGCPDPGPVVACTNGLLEVSTRDLQPHDPRFFNLVSVPFDYQPDAPAPSRWLEFLGALWPDDQESVTALQQWFGYVLSGRTHLQKILLIHGPRRSGKGTIARVLQALVGKGNYAGPTLASLGQNFGLQPLIGTPLAVVSDARLRPGQDPVSVIVERLLSISGEDSLTIDRKYRDPWTGRLPTRFMILSNELPAFGDASGAIVTRFVVLAQQESWLGREDHGLADALLTELPGILNWALDGLSALEAAGRLTEPASGMDAVVTMADAASPKSAFVRERCQVGAGLEVPPEQIYAAWKGWCLDNGHDHPGTVQTFVRDLRAVVPAVHTVRPRRSDGSRYRVLQGIGLLVRDGPRSNTIVSSTQPLIMGTGIGEKTIDADRGPSRTIPVTSTDAGTAGGVSRTRPEAGTGAAKTTQRELDRGQARMAAAGESVPLPVSVGRSGKVIPIDASDAHAEIGWAVERSGGALTVDVETTGYASGHADYVLRTVQLGDEQFAVVLDPHDPEQAEVVRLALAAAPVLHAHSATADLVPLAHAGLTDESAWERMHDTVIPAKLADPNSTGSDPGLKQLAGAVLGEAATALAADAARAALFKVNKWLTDVVLTTPVERSGWAQVDPTCTTMIRYAASDVLDTAALAQRLPQLPADLVERERAVQRITARVTHRGLAIDRDHVAALQAEHEPAMVAAAARVGALGVDNPGSDRQLAGRLTELGVALPRTKPSARHPEGQPSVAAGVLESLCGLPSEAAELVSAVLAYRHHETVLSTFLGPYRALCERGDGRARPTVYTLGTDTGRMSCVRPNLQQLPRQGGVRACITADPGHVLISADFSGVEVRVMAALSQDPNLVRMIHDGGRAQALVVAGRMTKDEWQRRYDLHAMVAEQAFGPQFTKADRYTAKRGVFGWAYGGGIPSLARQIGVSESTMAAIVDSLQLVAPTYVAWADEVKRQIRSGATQMPTYSGRIIHLPREYPHKGPNYCIQGMARELLVDALLAWDETRWAGGVVLPVHDEIVAMVPEQDAVEATAELVRCMTRELYGIEIVAEAGQPSFVWRDSA